MSSMHRSRHRRDLVVQRAVRRRLRVPRATRPGTGQLVGPTARTSCGPPTATASTTSCCRRATRSASTRPRSPRQSPRTPSRSTCCSPCGWARCGSHSSPASSPRSTRWPTGGSCINIISSDIPGEALESAPRYQRTREWMQVLRQLLERRSRSTSTASSSTSSSTRPGRRRCPARARRSTSADSHPPAKDVAAAEADVFLTWPDTVAAVGDDRRRHDDAGARHATTARCSTACAPT